MGTDTLTLRRSWWCRVGGWLHVVCDGCAWCACHIEDLIIEDLDDRDS